MPDEPRIEISDHRDEAERRAILEPLLAFNRSRAPDPDFRALNVLLRDGADDIVGGLWGHTAWGWFVVELLFVPETLRGRGIGRRLLLAGEREARVRGCANAWLDTHGFQARGFYERLGYTRFGELPNYPSGHARHFLRKALSDTCPD